EQPAEGERCRVAQPGEALEPVEDRVRAEMLVHLRPLRHPGARGRSLAALVLPRQPAAGERAEGREAEPVLRAEWEHLALRLAIEQRVRVLHPAEAAGGERLAQLRALDVRDAVR